MLERARAETLHRRLTLILRGILHLAPLYIMFEGQWLISPEWPSRQNLADGIGEFQRYWDAIAIDARIIVELRQGQNIPQDQIDI